MDAETNSTVVGQRNYDHKTWSEKDTLRTRGYILRDTLGEGTYSKVKRACSVRLQRDVAIKIICREKAPEVFEKKFLPREIEILSFVKHARIIRVYEIFETKVPGRVYIVTELLNSKDLLEYVKAQGSVCESEARKIFLDVCQALSYLHNNLIAHRDIKCENILLHKRIISGPGFEFIAKLCDFGFARKFPSQQCIVTNDSIDCITSTFCGSAAYASPEILERKRHNPMLADVWSLGIVFFITIYGVMPFDDTNIKAMVAKQKRGDLIKNRSKNISRLEQDLITQALQPNPQKRPFIKTLLDHRWLYENKQSTTSSMTQSSNAEVKVE